MLASTDTLEELPIVCTPTRGGVGGVGGAATSENNAVLHATGLRRLSSPGKDGPETSVEEGSDDCKPQQGPHEFWKC